MGKSPYIYEEIDIDHNLCTCKNLSLFTYITAYIFTHKFLVYILSFLCISLILCICIFLVYRCITNYCYMVHGNSEKMSNTFSRIRNISIIPRIQESHKNVLGEHFFNIFFMCVYVYTYIDICFILSNVYVIFALRICIFLNIFLLYIYFQFFFK